MWETEADVLADTQMREERSFLRDIPDPARLGSQLASAVVDDNPADLDPACVRGLEAADHAQQSCLAATRGPEDRGDRTVGNDEIEALQHLVAPKRLLQTRDPDLAHVAEVARPAPRYRESRTAGIAESPTITAAYGAAAP